MGSARAGRRAGTRWSGRAARRELPRARVRAGTASCFAGARAGEVEEGDRGSASAGGIRSRDSERTRSESRRNGSGPEHPRIAPLHEAGDRDHAEGQAGHRVERAHVDGPALEGLEGQPLPLEAGLEDLLHLGPRRAGRDGARGRRGRRSPRAPRRGRARGRSTGRRPCAASRPTPPTAPRRRASRASPRGAPRPAGAPPRRPRGAAGARGDRRPSPPRRLALRLPPRAQAEDPAAEAGDDAGLAAQLVPPGGPRAGHRGRAARRRGRARRSGTPSPRAARGRGSGTGGGASARRGRSAGAARGAGGGGCRGASRRSVKSGAYVSGRGRTTPISSKGTPRAASRSSRRAIARTSAASPGAVTSSTAPSLASRPAAAARRGPRAGAAARPAARGARAARAASRSTRPRPRRARRAGRGRTRAAATAAARAAARARGGRGERGHELDLDGVELQVVGDEDLGPVEPARAGEPLARRGEERRGVRGAPLEGAVEAAVEAGERGEAARVVRSRGAAAASAARRSGAIPAPPQGGEGAGEGGGHRRARRPLGEAQARVAALREEPRGEERVVAARPGLQPPPEEDGLGQRPREVERLHRVDAGQGAAGRGEAPRQLDRGGEGRREEDEGAQGQGGEAILAPASAARPWAIIPAWTPSSGSSATSSG